MTKILVLGGVAYNTIIYLEQFPAPRSQNIFSKGYFETVGETGAGKAMNLSKLGMYVTLHGLIGNDESGLKICRLLQDWDVRFMYDIDPKGTERHVNLMDENGGRISIFMASSTLEPTVNTTKIETAISESDLVILNIQNYCRHLIPIIQKYEKEIWCDIHDYDGNNAYHKDFINASDYVFMSSDQMPNYRAFLEQLIRSGKRLAVCTHGAKGSTALTPDWQWIETPVIPDYQRVDTNGAGDAFFAGFIHGHIRGFTVHRCLEMATIVSGLCITSHELAYPRLSLELADIEFHKYFKR